MLKRPGNSRFNDRIRAGIKITTIREKPWPVGKPIMLYNWSGKPYGSPQRDVCAVEVVFTCPFIITRIQHETERPWHAADELRYAFASTRDHAELLRQLEEIYPISKPSHIPPFWYLEGFDSQDDMDAWFRAVLKPGTTTEMHLCRFKTLP